jgi:hypothetical protein
MTFAVVGVAEELATDAADADHEEVFACEQPAAVQLDVGVGRKRGKPSGFVP